MVAIAAAVLVAFIGGLYFITHHKKEESETLQSQKVAGNGLPPKPEERWRYIKELESRQPGVRAPTEPSAGGEVEKPEQLTNEQRQLLAQMQADMRQQPTQLNEVPWNEQTQEQRQQTLQRQRQAQQQVQQQMQQQQWSNVQVEQPTDAAAGDGAATHGANRAGAGTQANASAKAIRRQPTAVPGSAANASTHHGNRAENAAGRSGDA
jgi:cell division protein FtsN